MSQIEYRISFRKNTLFFVILNEILDKAVGFGAFDKIFNEIFTDGWINLTDDAKDFNFLRFYLTFNVCICRFSRSKFAYIAGDRLS